MDSEFEPEGALNYCPFCSSSFVRLEDIDSAGCRYRCGDCETPWTMVDPTL
jgi:formate dehydrogenase maturation protein FdhE